MKSGKFAWAVLFAVVAVAGVGQLAAYEEEAEAEVQVVEPSGSESFRIGEDDVVRLKANGIAGATESVTITGPAKVTRKIRVRKIANGQPSFGPSGVEFEVKPTGRGKVVAKVKVVNPTDPDNPKVTTYNFAVE